MEAVLNSFRLVACQPPVPLSRLILLRSNFRTLGPVE